MNMSRDYVIIRMFWSLFSENVHSDDEDDENTLEKQMMLRKARKRCSKSSQVSLPTSFGKSVSVLPCKHPDAELGK